MKKWSAGVFAPPLNRVKKEEDKRPTDLGPHSQTHTNKCNHNYIPNPLATSSHVYHSKAEYISYKPPAPDSKTKVWIESTAESMPNCSQTPNQDNQT